MRVLPVLFLFGGVGCSNEAPDLVTRLPSIAVAPGEIDFGEVGVPLSATLPLYVSNGGGGDLIGSMQFGAFDDVFAIDQGLRLDVQSGDEMVLDVRFTPDTFRDYESILEIQTNDPDRPLETITVRGVGADLPLPDIRIDPGLTIEVFDKKGGDPALALVTIANEGGAPLDVSDLRIQGDPAFALTSPFEPTMIAPDSSVSVLVQYDAPDSVGQLTDLFVSSNDPDEPVVQVRILGNGGGPDLDRPVAVIDCPALVELTGPERRRLSGAKSYDPDGLEPLAFAWTVLSRPDASDADVTLDPDDTEEIDLYVDVAGEWSVQLVVENSLQTASDPTVCTFQAVPEDDLRVELSWNTAAADMDLHLLRDGADLFDAVFDCHYCNQNPSWGTSSLSDDPRLDIDDRAGFGPENINIEAPEQLAYDVKVHYFKSNGDKAVTATVLVWIAGELAWSGQRVLEDPKDLWDVGTVNIVTGNFQANSTSNSPNQTGGCE